MLTILKKNNIEPIKSINEKLDPNLHQAMMEVEDDEKAESSLYSKRVYDERQAFKTFFSLCI